MNYNELIEKGYEAYEHKKETKAGIVMAFLITFILMFFITAATVVTLASENKAYKHQIEQRDSLIKALTATNNELVNDNLNLSNGK